MCLHITKLTHKQTADKDILVFKMCYEHKGLYLSYFLDYSYQKGLYKSNITKEEAAKPCNNQYCYDISVALHSYDIDTMIIKNGRTYKVGYGKNYNNYHDLNEPDDLRVGLFTVPKGTEYYYEDGVIASRAIRYEDIYGRIFTKEDFVNFLKYFMNVPISKIYT